MDIQLLAEQALQILAPGTIADFFIYGIFVLTLVTIASLPKGNDLPLYLMYGLILCCVLDLLRDGANLPIEGTDNSGFFTFLIHIAMFVLPAVSAGAIRKSKLDKKGGYARPLCILLTLVAGLYAVGTFAAPDIFYSAV